MMNWIRPMVVLGTLALGLVTITALASGFEKFELYEWTEINDDAAWGPRAGLETVALGRSFYLMGGRTPNPYVPPPEGPIPGDSEILGDVWRSDYRRATWELILETDDSDHWPARAHHEAVAKNGRIFVLGGQNFGLIPNPECDFDPACFPRVPLDVGVLQ